MKRRWQLFIDSTSLCTVTPTVRLTGTFSCIHNTHNQSPLMPDSILHIAFTRSEFMFSFRFYWFFIWLGIQDFGVEHTNKIRTSVPMTSRLSSPRDLRCLNFLSNPRIIPRTANCKANKTIRGATPTRRAKTNGVGSSHTNIHNSCKENSFLIIFTNRNELVNHSCHPRLTFDPSNSPRADFVWREFLRPKFN